jgi:trans-aconitate methyltransferase
MSGQDDDGLDWSAYYRWLDGRPVRALCERGLREYGEVPAGATAVDLGCGDGTETRALLAAGFAVTAVDSAGGSMDMLRRLPGAGTTLTLVPAAMQDVDLPPADLVHASLSLPFCPPEQFDGLWARICAALRPGGLVVCDLFGDRHAWAGEDGMTFVTRARVLDLVSGLDLRSLHEIEEETQSFRGPTHWHAFQVVARA